MHFVLDRPHLNDGARMARIKPRYNADVNEWWLCDEGRYGLDWLDRERLDVVRGPAGDATWEQAMETISSRLAADGARVGVIASAQLSNEELFLIREVFQGAQISANVPEQPGTSDDFLITADKNPNTLGATMLGLAGPGAPLAGQILDDALAGNLDVVWVFGHDLVDLFGEDKVRELPNKVDLLVFSGTNENATAALAHWTLPTAGYVEKDGTFVNCDGRVQRIGRVMPPYGRSREDWRLLLQLAELLDRPLDWAKPDQIFAALAEAEAPFAGLSHEGIGDEGVAIKPGSSTPAASQETATL